MASSGDEDVIRLWLETNLAEAASKGAEAVEELRDQAKAMGPEVGDMFDKMAGSATKAAEATIEAVEAQSRLQQGMFDFPEVLELVSEKTKIVTEETVRRTQATLDFTEVLHLQGGTERDLSTLSQEVLRRMQERQDAQAGVNLVIEQTTQDLRAQAAAEQALGDIVAKNQETINAAGTNFSKLSGNIVKAEKAAFALASGSGLGRVGPMLESVTMGLTGIGGIGMALGAVAIALEGMLPKIESWINKWEKGEKQVDAVKQALAGLDHATELTDRERALKRTNRQIAKLEAKEDTDGFLSGMDKEDLQRLEAAAFNTRRQIAEEKLVNSAGQSKKDRARGAAVKEALAETGGGGAGAARMLADRDDISIDEAYTIVAGAMEGSGHDITRLKAHVPKFAEQFAITDPETKLAKEADKLKKKTAHEQEKAWQHGINLQDSVIHQSEAADARHIAKEGEEELQAQVKAAKDETAATKKAARDAERAQKKAEREHKKAEHEAAKFAREHTPLALYHAAKQKQENEDLGMIENYAPNLDPELQKSAAKHARANHQAGMDLSATFQQALDYAIEQARQDFARGIEAGIRHSAGHRPTQYNRGQG